MQIIKQDDYDNFKCIADKCPSSCCVGWQIVIDEESLEKYRAIDDNFAKRINHAIDFDEGAFRQNDRRCVMLRDDNLCELQKCKGEAALCYTCTMFPRHQEEYEDIRELSLSMSCPEVARMVTNRVEPYTFVETENDELEDFDDFDYLLYTNLVDAREVIFKIVQNRQISINTRMSIIVEFSRELQNCVDDDCIFEMGDIIEKYGELKLDPDVKEFEIISVESMDDISVLCDLERLDEDWTTILEKTLEKMKNSGEIRINKEEIIATEQILVLLIYTYFCGSVYDDWIYSKMALCVKSIQWILLIFKSTDLTLVEALYKYSKEIEHSDLNLNALEEYFMENY